MDLDISKFIEGIGIVGLLIGFFIQRDIRQEKRSNEREDSMSKRLREVEDFQREQMVEMITRSTAALEKLSERPCLAEGNKRNV